MVPKRLGRNLVRFSAVVNACLPWDSAWRLNWHPPIQVRFEEQYGSQRTLLSWCIEILQERGFAIPAGALRAAQSLEAA
jgi:hypothetical protein